jgi:hypothetical protein
LPLGLPLAACLFKRLDCRLPQSLCLLASAHHACLFFSLFPCFQASAMGDFFSGFDLNVRLEEDENENLPFDVNDGNGNATVTL